MAPKAAQIVYQGPNSTQGVNDTYNKIVTDNKAQITTISWGECETASGAAELQTLDTIFKQGAAQGKYKAVPDRYLFLRSFQLSAECWEEFQIPVGMAFFFSNSALGRVTGFYPSPAGATESLLPLAAWQELAAANPILETMEPDVEALLINRRRGAAAECYLVPIDACYELTGIVRRRWKGFDGGQEAWRDIDASFDGLRARSR